MQVFPGSFVPDEEGQPRKPRDMFTDVNFKKFTTKHGVWANKQATALFRGTATGGGVTPETNQRIKLAVLSKQWENHRQYGGAGGAAAFLDCKITGWNFRDKKIVGESMTFVKKKTLEKTYQITGNRGNYIPM